MGGRGKWVSEFKARLVYRVSSRTARMAQRNPISKTKQNKKKNKPKQKQKNKKPKPNQPNKQIKTKQSKTQKGLDGM